MDTQSFRYQPLCSARGCRRPALFKVAAPWTNGTSHELKNYGLTCEEHRADQLARARSNREGLTLAEGESVGKVGLYRLKPGVRDHLLEAIPDAAL